MVNNNNEIVMTLFEDIATMIRSVAKDYLPTKNPITIAENYPPRITLQIREHTSDIMQELVTALATNVKEVVERIIPSLPIVVKVIGGSEAVGFQITIKEGTDLAPVYGHIIKAKIAWLKPVVQGV